MIAVPFILAFILGIFLLSSVCRSQLQLNMTLFYSLGFGLGLCACALITYVSFLIWGGLQPRMILGSYILVLSILLFVGLKHFPIKKHLQGIQKKWKYLFLIFPFALLVYCGILVAAYQPFGAWDAWAVYNLKFRFLALGGESWTAIYRDLHWYTQPNYPLMVPFIYTWIYAFTQQGINFIPQLTGIIFYLTIGLILIGALAQFIQKRIAVLTGLILFVIPFYIYVATAQYADVVLSFCLLTAIVSTFMYVQRPMVSSGILAGLTLGWMSFVKNEGLVCMLLLIVLSLFYLFFSRRGSLKLKTKSFIPFSLSVFLSSFPTVIHKLFFAPKNTDIFSSLSFRQMEFFNLSGLKTILYYGYSELTQQHWSFCWIFMALLMILSVKNIFRKTHGLLAFFFLSYGLVLLVIYLTTVNFDLMWRLENSLPRILFYILPSFLFSVSIWSFRVEKISS